LKEKDFDEKSDSQSVQKRKKYAVISDEQRKKLHFNVINQGKDIKEVAKELNLNISTAKGIIKTYMTEGRVSKKKTRNRSFLEILNQPRPQPPQPFGGPILNSTTQNSPIFIIMPQNDPMSPFTPVPQTQQSQQQSGAQQAGQNPPPSPGQAPQTSQQSQQNRPNLVHPIPLPYGMTSQFHNQLAAQNAMMNRM